MFGRGSFKIYVTPDKYRNIQSLLGPDDIGIYSGYTAEDRLLTKLASFTPPGILTLKEDELNLYDKLQRAQTEVIAPLREERQMWIQEVGGEFIEVDPVQKESTGFRALPASSTSFDEHVEDYIDVSDYEIK